LKRSGVQRCTSLTGNRNRLRHDADDSERLGVEEQLTADDGRIAAELGLPEPVAEDHRAGRAVAVVALANGRPISG
jgi:hypothetical protein